MVSVKLSVAIISFNEEKNIGRTLASLAPFADEVVVVDSFSTDGTAKICQEMGAKVISRKFGGYGEQKNFALKSCRYDVVLSIDADEVVGKKLQNSIVQAKENWGGPYSFNRLNNYLGKWIYHSGLYPDRQIRLVDRREASWSETRVHEKILLKDGQRATVLPGDLLHYSYDSVFDHIDKINKYTSLSAEDYLERGEKVFYF